MRKKKRNVSEEVKNGIRDLEEKLTEIEKTMQINTKELREKQKEAEEADILKEAASEEVKETEENTPVEAVEPSEVAVDGEETKEVEVKVEVVKNDSPEEKEEPKEEAPVLEENADESKEETSVPEEKPEEVVVNEIETPSEELMIPEEIKEEVVVEEKPEEVTPEEVKDVVEFNKKERPIKQKRTHNTVIFIICIIVALLLYVLPFLFVTFFAIKHDYSSKYVELDNTIIIEDSETKISDINGYYDDYHKSYVVYGYVDNQKNHYLSVEFELYDINDYVIGTATYEMDMKKDTKYKLKAVYDGVDSEEIIRFKLKNIFCY